MGYLDQILILIVQCCNAIWLWDQDVTDSERSEVTLQPFNLYDRAVKKKKTAYSVLSSQSNQSVLVQRVLVV